MFLAGGDLCDADAVAGGVARGVQPDDDRKYLYVQGALRVWDGRMTYTRYNQQGYFGESFVRVLASAAGLIAGQQDLDHTGVDFSIDFPGARGTARFPKIEAQVKSWSSPKGNDLCWQYSMDVGNYNDLAGEGFVIPRYLFLIIVPPDVRQYAYVDETSMRLSHCGYWASLRDLPVVDPAAQQKITVHVPKSNLLTVGELRTLLQPMPAQQVPTS